MSAPTLADQWEQELRGLAAGWDSYDADPITTAAINAVRSFAVVPCSDGGLQLEVHRDGWDIEIEISPDGRIVSVLAEHPAAPALPPA